MSFEQLQKILADYSPDEIVIVGLGNHFCCDDRAGLLFFEKLHELPDLSGSLFINAGCNPENYLMQIIDHKPKLVLFVDAVENSQNFESIKLYNSDEISDSDFSTHAYSIGFIEKFIKMNIITEIKYLGISIENSRPGTEISTDTLEQIEDYFKI
jgi:hydrogenase maturation protease